jgi:hypothetical protein
VGPGSEALVDPFGGERELARGDVLRAQVRTS